MSAEVAVAILHHGSIALTEECLRSTLRLDPAPARQLVIWNEVGSDPGDLSPDLASQIEVVPTGSNLGFSGGANFAARAASERGAEWLWLLNNDTEVAIDALAILLGVGEDPRVAMVGPRIISMADGRIWHDGGAIHWPEGRPLSVGYGGVPAADGGSPRPVEFVCGCAPLIRLAPFLENGGFDDRFYLYYEDADLSLRLTAAGFRLLHAPRAEVRHHGSASTGSRSPSSRYYALRNRRLFRDLHAPDTVAAHSASEKEARTVRWRALRYGLLGRSAEARALRDALADHAAGRYGERGDWRKQRTP